MLSILPYIVCSGLDRAKKKQIEIPTYITHAHESSQMSKAYE